jgi:hypothetical protein
MDKAHSVVRQSLPGYFQSCAKHRQKTVKNGAVNY